MAIEITFSGTDIALRESLLAKSEQVTAAVIAKLDILDLQLQAKIVSEHLHGPTGPTTLQQRSGKLAGSIVAIPAQQQGNTIVGSVEGARGPAWYGRVQHEGTGPFEILPVKAKALRFEVNGQVVFAKRVMHPGLPARPFMTAALEESKEALIASLQEALMETVT